MEQAITARMSFTVMAAMDTAIHTARDQAPRTIRKGASRWQRVMTSPGLGILALRDDAFKAKLAGVGEDSRVVSLDVLVEPDANPGLDQDHLKRGLAAL